MAKRRGAAFADVRILHRRSESILVQDGRADKLSAATDRGIGVRVLVGRCWGFASADSLDRSRAEQCLADAIDLAKASEAFVSDPAMIADCKPVVAEDRREPEIPPGAMSVREKIARLLEYERVGRDLGGAAIVNSIVNYSDGQREEVLANTAGTARPHQRLPGGPDGHDGGERRQGPPARGRASRRDRRGGTPPPHHAPRNSDAAPPRRPWPS